MKTSTFLLLLLMFLAACGTSRMVTVDRLRLGMTRGDVEHMFGPPQRILVVSQTEYGYQEVLQYKTHSNELYALEFVNDQLVRYEFLGDDMEYIPLPPPPPIVVYPDYPVRPMPVERPPVVEPPKPPVTRPQPVPGRVEQGSAQQGLPSRNPNTGSSIRPVDPPPSSAGRSGSVGNTNPGRSNQPASETSGQNRRGDVSSSPNQTQTTGTTPTNSGRR